MNKYPKIESLFKRDEAYKFIEGEFRSPEIEYLKDNIWFFTEKIDGTNIRVLWDGIKNVEFKGRTDNASLPGFLFKKLMELFPVDKFNTNSQAFPPMCLYGEGYGAKIQKGGGNYIPDGVDFILFDILIDNWWLERENIEGIAENLEIQCVPIVGEGTIQDGINLIKNKLTSTFGDFLAEGIVLKPKVTLFARNGGRIITKLKHKDFKVLKE